MLGELSRQQETNRRLDLSRRQRMFLVILDEFRRLRADLVEHIVDEAVHDAHRALRDTGIRMHLLQHSVDVDRICLHGLLMVAFLRAGLGGSLLDVILVGRALVTLLIGRLLAWHCVLVLFCECGRWLVRVKPDLV